jgi:hypothetical protein
MGVKGNWRVTFLPMGIPVLFSNTYGMVAGRRAAISKAASIRVSFLWKTLCVRAACLQMPDGL